MLLLGKGLDYSVRFGEPPAFAAGCRFVQVDADPAALAGADRVALAIAALPERVAEQMASAAAGRSWSQREWGDAIRGTERRRLSHLPATIAPSEAAVPVTNLSLSDAGPRSRCHSDG